MIRLDGPLLARAWLAVAAAASTDKEDPQVYKTVAIEEHPTGVRLVSTDRHLLLTAWVPDLMHLYGLGSHTPGIATLPDRTVLAADIAGRGRGMLGYVLSLAGQIKAADYTPGDIEVSIEFDARGPAGPDQGFEGMDPKHVVLRSPDVETVYIPTVEMPPVDWRRAIDAHKPAQARDVTYHAELLERIGRIAKHVDGPVRLHLGGRHTPTRIEYVKSDPAVTGVVVTVRDQAEVTEP